MEQAARVDAALKTLQYTGRIEEGIAEARREIDGLLRKTTELDDLAGLSSDGLLA